MARPADPNAPFRVSIHTINGYRYASTQPSTVDPETGRRSYRQVHWGTVDDNLKFIPGKHYIAASPEERRKLIFPEGWDISETDKLNGHRKQYRSAIEGQDENFLYGDIWLLEQIAESTGIRSDLIKVFDGNAEMADIILTLAIYLICENGSYCQPAAWQRIAKTPCSVPLTTAFIAKAVQSITEKNRMDLVRLRTARLKNGLLCATDSLMDTRYGNSMGSIPMQQTPEVVVYTQDGHMPVYYKTFPDSIQDSKSLDAILKDLDSAGLKNVLLITDRGYESIRNLETYIDHGLPMIMGTNVSQAHVINRIKGFSAFDHYPAEMELDIEEQIYYRQYELEYRSEGHRGNVDSAVNLRLNLYFDPERRNKELICIDAAVACQKRALEQIMTDATPLDDTRNIARAYNFYKLEYDEPSRILKSFTPDWDKIAYERSKAGYLANTTYKFEGSAMEAYRHYRLKDEQEKYSAIMNGVMATCLQRNWSESGKTGLTFIPFVARILWCCLGNIHRTKLKEEFDSTSDLLNEMRPIRYVEHRGIQPYITPFVGKQATICEAFGFKIPNGCTPRYAARKAVNGKRKRPSKDKDAAKD